MPTKNLVQSESVEVNDMIWSAVMCLAQEKRPSVKADLWLAAALPKSALRLPYLLHNVLNSKIECTTNALFSVTGSLLLNFAIDDAVAALKGQIAIAQGGKKELWVIEKHFPIKQ